MNFLRKFYNEKISLKSFSRILPFFLFLALFFIFSESQSFAQNKNFSTSYDVSYNVSSDENTRVTIDVRLKNNTSSFYASSYEVQTGFKKINVVSAKDLGGDLDYGVKNINDGAVIFFDFNTNVVGISSTQEFEIVFETGEITKNFGNIWEVNIPGISDQESFASFNAEVTVPREFGPPAFIKPNVKTVESSGNILKFTKNDLGRGGISISYGDAQIYEFNLNYHLENRHLFPTVSEIAIPSNNGYQEVQIENINPEPDDVYIDPDGNWLAKYKLKPSQRIDISVAGLARVSFKPKKESLSTQQKNIYLKQDKFWETQNPQLIKLAKDLKTPENIYRFVVNNLFYDPSRVREKQIRAGAANVLSNKKSAVCLEFTDLFIALVRASGIPARAVEGWANTTNTASRPLSIYKDVLHAWPQYYDFKRNAWIMVDPTWENTTGGIDYFNVFDFDHLTFVIKGVDSQYPIPAGGYKLNSGEEKDINVKAIKSYENKNPALSALVNFKDSYIAGLPIEGEVIIKNRSKIQSPNQNLLVESGNFLPNSQNLFFDKIPPYGKKIVHVKLAGTSPLTNKTGIIKITIGNETIEREIEVLPFYKSRLFYTVLGGVTIGIFIFIILFTAARAGRLSFFRRK